jgi:tetratricopeptide (TPR) repeat protein
MLELETDITRGRRLIREASVLAKPLNLDLCEMHWAYGLLQRWDGDYSAAITSLERALVLARAAEDRWREYNCLVWLAMLQLECGGTAGVIARCAELMDVAGRLGDSHVPFVATLDALARFADGEEGAEARLTHAMRELSVVDDKSYEAYSLNVAATVYLRLGRIAEAGPCAARALELAATMRRTNEVVIARAIDSRVAAAENRAGALPAIERLLTQNPAQFSMRARLVVAATAQAMGVPLPRSFQRVASMLKNPPGR